MKTEKSTTKMKFAEDKFLNGELAYDKDTVYEIENASVDRWKKRGGVVVTEADEVAETDDKGPGTKGVEETGKKGDAKSGDKKSGNTSSKGK